jgi:hypothetical protein
MKLLAIAALMGGAMEAAAAQGTVRGKVRNARTNEPVAGATVLVVGSRIGAIADSGGAYQIPGIPAGEVRIRARFIGFADAEQSIVLSEGETRTLDFRLTEAITTLGTVRTEAKAAEREVFEEKPNLGVTMLSAKVVSSVPRLGEADILRVAQLMPGVNARNDFTAGLNVRGGEADQNLILIDGYPIFNPFHLGGLYGTFIDGSIDGIELRTGGFAAPYGGRLSAVLDVQSKEETRGGIHGSGTISMLATSATVGSMFGGGKGTWMIAGRRTYADKVLDALDVSSPPYFFRDGLAHATYRPFSRTTISTTLYDGTDNLTADLATADDATGGGGFTFFWGNRVAGVTVAQQLTDSLTLEQRASYTIFKTVLDLGDPETGQSTIRLDDLVREKTLAGSLALTHGAHAPSLGYSLSRDDMVYTAGSEAAGVEFINEAQHPLSLSGYVNDVWKVNPKLMLEGGFRYEWLQDSRWHSVSPRLSAKYFATHDLAFTGAVGRYSQWLHSLNREDIPVRLFDFYTSSDSAVDVARATHFVLGAERWFGSSRFARLETYAKRYGRLLDPNPFEEPEVHGDEYIPLTGRSYGADLLLRQLERGRWSGWIAYTYTFSTRTNDTATYYPGQDRRNNVNVVVSYRKSPKTVLSARLGYASGTPYTFIQGQLTQRTYDINTGRWQVENETSTQVVGGQRNGLRLPPTQRLDVTLTRDLQKGVKFTPFISVVNLYNAKNVFYYSFDYQSSPPTRTAYSQIPFLPTFGVTIEW